MYGHLWNKVSNQLPESVTGSINNMRERDRQTDRNRENRVGGAERRQGGEGEKGRWRQTEKKKNL